MNRKKKRNRMGTQQRIVDALQSVIADQGLDGVSISEIATRAQVSKVLIYRYFGGLEGLLDYYVHQGAIYPPFAPNFPEPFNTAQEGDLAKLWTSQTLQLFRQLRSSKADRELLKVGLTGEDTLSSLLSQAQDAELSRFVEQLAEGAEVPGNDPQVMLAIVLGGLSYLTILAHTDRSMLGIDLRSEAGWQRVEAALKALYQSLDKSRQTSRLERSTQRQAGLVVHEW
ncbi:TetR/AcrR family transcriptional regulator [Spirosoma koreense]